MAENNGKAPRKRGPGKPFQKGVSGNPGGRPKAPELFKEHSEEAQRRVIELMRSDNTKVAIQAATLVLAYGFGKPTEHIEHTASEDLRTLILSSFGDKDER